MIAETRIIRVVARVAPWLAPIPSGYFVARSSFRHLLASDAPWLAYTVAIIAGLMLELLGVASIHTLQDLNRWNRQGMVKRDGGWEKAPTGAAKFAVAIYFAGTFSLLFVLETLPSAATVAPFLFPLIAIAGSIVLSTISQHDERKERAGVDDTLKPGSLAARQERERQEAERKVATIEQGAVVLEPEQADDEQFRCDWPGCGRGFGSQNALNAHSRIHGNGKVRAGELLEFAK